MSQAPKSLSKPFHEVTLSEFTDYFMKVVCSLPLADWDSIKPGDYLCYERRYGYVVISVPPKRGYIMVYNHRDAEKKPIRLSRKQTKLAELQKMSPSLKKLLGVTHGGEIKKAVEQKLPVPPLVQFDYPEIFTPFPADFTEEDKKFAINEFNNMKQWNFGPNDEIHQKALNKLNSNHRGIAQRSRELDGLTYGCSDWNTGWWNPDNYSRNISSVTDYIKSFEKGVRIYQYLVRHIEATLMKHEGIRRAS